MMNHTSIQEAREQVCQAGRQLLQEGLVARTWGNVSVRLNDREMVITPSGRKYDELSPEDMVIVDIQTLAFQGKIKPSSELKLHCQIYKTRPQIGAVIHTHQMYASIIAAAHQDIEVEDPLLQKILGAKRIQTAPYALPNTRKITMATASALGDAYAAVMANHGAVCTGSDLTGAFEVTRALERACQMFIELRKNRHEHRTG